MVDSGIVVTKFVVGDRICISPDFFWAKGATGTVSKPPEQVIKISGPRNDGGLTDQERSALGQNTFYWVWLDEPQFDADGDGLYRGGCIWESALTLLSRIS